MHSALDCLRQLRVNRSQTITSPHKPCLILAVLCEIQSGHITTPIIPIDTRLIARYYELFQAACNERINASPWLPLWHLRTDKGCDGEQGSLWNPILHKHVVSIANHLGQAKSLRQIEERFQCAELDAVLFSALQNEVTRREAAALLLTYYFDKHLEGKQRLEAYINAAFASGDYEKHPDKLHGEVRESSQATARSAAFRALVLEAYDYRCAASRRRFITPDFRYLVEAAHLVPFSISQDDRPTNGLALTPDLHWAVDNYLIAPGPDRRWHVSKSVDALIEDNAWLWRLDGQPLYLPKDERSHPQPTGLEWRMDHLLR